jgi:MFS family permease
MKNEIQLADPIYRRKVVLALVAGAIIGALLIALFQHALDWAASEPERAVTRLGWVVVTLIPLALPMLLMSRWVWRVGKATVEAGRYPPPSMKLVRDTPVVRGSEATRRGRLVQAVAIMLGVVSLGLPIALSLLIGLLVQST